jgi:hypothetical protein
MGNGGKWWEEGDERKKGEEGVEGGVPRAERDPTVDRKAEKGAL